MVISGFFFFRWFFYKIGIYKQICLANKWDFTILSQNGQGINCYEGALHNPQSYKTRASPSDAVQCHYQDTPFWHGLSTLEGIQS